MDMILGILFIAKGSWAFALLQLLTYWLTSANELVDELYLLSCHNNPVDTLPLDDDRLTFDPAMTAQEGLEQLLRQFLPCYFASLREASRFSIFSRQDAKGAKVFDPSARGLVIYWMLHVSGTIPFTPMA